MYLIAFTDLCKHFKFPIHFTLIKIDALEGNKVWNLKRMFGNKME